MATKLVGFNEPTAPAWTTCTVAILPWRNRRLAVGRTRITSAVLRPARSQKNQQSGSSAIFPNRMYASAGGSAAPRSHRDTAIADAFNRLPSSPWVSFRVWRKVRILRDHSGRARIDFRSMHNPNPAGDQPAFEISYITPSEIKSQVRPVRLAFLWTRRFNDRHSNILQNEGLAPNHKIPTEFTDVTIKYGKSCIAIDRAESIEKEVASWISRKAIR
jgi:hypothetical protein